MKLLGKRGKNSLFTIAAVSALFLASCSSDDPDGLWDPIKMDKGMALISDAGGCDTIRVKNYSSWWLTDVDVRVNDTTIHRHPTYEEGVNDEHHLSGDWYDIQIPTDNRKLLIVRCEANPRHDYRELRIGVTVGDAFNSVRVIQAASD